MKRSKFSLFILFSILICCIWTISFISEASAKRPKKARPISGYEIVVGETVVSSSPIKQLRVDCPEGKKALGAGWSVLDATGAILDGRATYFQPAFDGSHWLVNTINTSTFAPDWKLRVRVICADVGE